MIAYDELTRRYYRTGFEAREPQIPIGYVTRVFPDGSAQVQVGPIPWYVRWGLLRFWNWCKEPLR